MEFRSCSDHHHGDPTPKRRSHTDDSHAGRDLLSALPDELLIAILERVDSQTAVSTSVLSRRWRRLDPAGNLSAFEFSVATHLPPEYAAAVDLYLEARARGDHGDLAAIADLVYCCEDSAMAAYARGLASFLGAPDRCPLARSLRLELLVMPWDAVAGPETAACLLAAFRFPNLERLAIAAAPRARSLAALHVTNCFLSGDGHSYGAAFPALSALTVETTPRGVGARLPSAYFNNLMCACRQLQSLRLVSCDLPSKDDDEFTVDLPPASRLRELVMETFNYGEVKIVSAPSLERLVLERCGLYSVRVESGPRLETLVCRGSVPRLSGAGMASLRFVAERVGSHAWGVPAGFLLQKGIPNVEELTLRFRGRMIFAPSSETLELKNTPPCKKTSVNSQHNYLKEIEMVGFEGADQQMALVRFFMTSCSALKTVILIRHRALLEEKLGRQGGIACPSWLMEDEKVEMVSQLRHGIHSDAEIVLG